MASSPPAYSPPQSNLSLPMKRPLLTLPPNPNPAKRRKPSVASASAHPLRQTSFPPADSLDSQHRTAVYSPGSARSDSLDIDDEIASAVGSGVNGSSTIDGHGSAKKKTKRKGTGKLGRPPKSAARGDTASLVDGETSTVISRRKGGGNGTSAYGQNGAEEDDGSEDEDADGGEDAALIEGGKLSKAHLNAEKERRALFLSSLPPQHAERYGLWNRIHLKKDVVRKVTNQTLSQSVPQSVVTTINSYTKLFAGEIVERAREVQREWVAAAEKLPTGEVNEQGGAEGEARVAERDCGPLLPDHLREALRRYKRDRDGGTVGFTGMSLEGRETAAVRNGGRKLFR